MTSYTHATILEAQNDGKPPNENVEKGDKHIKAGKHESDEITYLDENNEIHVISFEPAATYDFGERMDSNTAIQRAKDRWFNKTDGDALCRVIITPQPNDTESQPAPEPLIYYVRCAKRP